MSWGKAGQDENAGAKHEGRAKEIPGAQVLGTERSATYEASEWHQRLLCSYPPGESSQSLYINNAEKGQTKAHAAVEIFLWGGLSHGDGRAQSGDGSEID